MHPFMSLFFAVFCGAVGEGPQESPPGGPGLAGCLFQVHVFSLFSHSGQIVWVKDAEVLRDRAGFQPCVEKVGLGGLVQRACMKSPLHPLHASRMPEPSEDGTPNLRKEALGQVRSSGFSRWGARTPSSTPEPSEDGTPNRLTRFEPLHACTVAFVSPPPRFSCLSGVLTQCWQSLLFAAFYEP
jgi:hypothetical protein